LLHDDVIDDGQLRRGKPAARTLWGNAVSVLAGDFLLARALELIDDTHAGALTRMLRVIRKMVEGEALQLDRRGKLDLRDEIYRGVVDAKTASLFAWCGEAGALAAGADDSVAQALGTYGFHLGRAFQIVDDVLDLSSEADALGKDLLSDLREGKMTLPVLMLLRQRADLGQALKEAADATHTSSERLRELAVVIAREAAHTGALGQARAEAVAETRAACAALAALPHNPYREALGQIARELAERGC